MKTGYKVRLGLLAVLLLPTFVWVALLFRPDRAEQSEGGGVEKPLQAVSTANTQGAGEPAAAVAEERSTLADTLNVPGRTAREDVAVVEGLLTAWRTNFRGAGNPVGDNVEITEALCGRNPLGYAFLERNHPAINAAGELCDRWGTPFRFHAWTGTSMQVWSAGEDRKFGTADDVSSEP